MKSCRRNRGKRTAHRPPCHSPNPNNEQLADTPMPTMNLIQAIRSGLEVMLERDPNVCVFGEDVGYFGGVFRATQGLQERFGSSRVFDTPLAGGGLVGVAIGMGLNGLRPGPAIQIDDYTDPPP